MLRKLALSLAVAGALVSTQANALGLGDIRIKSALNEPLNAEIQLLQVRDLNPLQIKPRMADQDEFALAGVSQQRALSDVRFQVKVNPNGTGVIMLTSRRPIKEPFMNFLVEVNWPSGRLVREYTVLLDPPVFDPTPTQRVVEPAQTRPAEAMPSIKSAPASVQSAASNVRSRADKKTQTYVDVKDTLWEIAIRYRAAPDISSYQMMVALQKKNPHAFPDGNINNLKAGVTIDLPTEAEARAVTSEQAAAEVRRQTGLWKQKGQVATSKAPVDGSKKSLKSEAADSNVAEEADNGQLKVVTPPEAAQADDAALNDQTKQADSELDEKQALINKNEELENKLAVSMESIDRLERDNNDLSEKMDAIQQQLDSLQRLIELKDQQMAALQTELTKKAEMASTPPAAPEKSLIDKIMQTPEYLAGLGAGLIAVLAGVWLIIRRKKQQEEAAEEAEFMASAIADPDIEDMTDQISLDDSPLDELDSMSDELAIAAAEEAANDVADELQMSELDDLDDLNLDMDLDLDESFEDELDALAVDDLAQDTPEENNALDIDDEDLLGSILEEQEEVVADEEFDLGVDDIEDELADLDQDDNLMADLDEELAMQDDPADLDIDSSLDDLLTADASEEEFIEQSRQRNERSGMGSVEPLTEIDETEDTLESLGLDSLMAESSETSENEEELEFELSDTEPADVEAQLAEIDAELESLEFDSADLINAEEPDDFEMDLMADLDSILDDTDEAQEQEPEVDLGADLDFELTDETDLSSELDAPELSEVDSLDAEVAPVESANDLDLAGIELDDTEDSLPKTPSDAEVTEELTSNIEHDLDAELDGELEALLNSTDNDIALEETVLEDEPVLDSLGLLDGADEVETKLDLARAYIDMDDAEGAKDILQEILQEGNEAQKAEATGLMEGLA